MAIKFEKIQPGMTLWTTERVKMGNTSMRQTVAVEHKVTAVGTDSITVYRNGRAVWVPKRRAEKMRATNPTCSECQKVGRHLLSCSKSRRAEEG